MGRMRRAVLLVCALAGCDRLFGFDEPVPIPADPIDASGDDASPPADDAPPIDAPALCSTQPITCSAPVVTSCGGTCWVACPDAVTESVASARCTAWGGRLARLTSTARDACIRSTVAPAGDLWIGLEQRTEDQVLEGWSWNSDNVAPPFFNFDNSGSGNQPDDRDGVENSEENCAAIANGRSKWNDTACGGSRAFACSDGS
jgi:hypothetical protein